MDRTPEKQSNFLSKNQQIVGKQRSFGSGMYFWRVLQGVKNKIEKEIILNFWAHLPKKYYENIIIEAGEYSAKNKLLDHGVGLIDTIILMHGIKSNSKIWTFDNKFLRIIPTELKYSE